MGSLFVLTVDAILHPHDGDEKSPNSHLRPETYDIVLFNKSDFQAMMGMSFMVFEGIN